MAHRAPKCRRGALWGVEADGGDGDGGGGMGPDPGGGSLSDGRGVRGGG